MSSEEIQEIKEVFEPEITESAEPQETQTAIPQPLSNKELARKKLTEKLEQGYDLANKEEKARLCHEIAEEIKNINGSCSYQTVSSEVNFVLKAKKEIKTEPEVSTVEGNTIRKNSIEKIKRPNRIIDETKELSDEQKSELIKNIQQPDEFEEMSIKFALQDVSFFISSLGLPKPQTKMLEQRAKQIAMYNNLQRQKGNIKNVIEISDSILKYAIYIGLISTFAQPIITKYFPKGKSNKKEITTKNESLI